MSVATKWKWGIVLSLALLVGLAIARRPRPDYTPVEPPPRVVTTATVTRERVAATVELTGTLQPVSRVDLTSPLPARVAAVLVSEGQEVSAGQLLARLDDREMRANLNKAEAGVAAAEAQVAQARLGAAMAADLATSRVDRARGGVTAAEGQVAGAQAGATLSSAAAAAQVEQAEGGLAAAQAALTQAQHGATLSRAEADSDAAQAAGALAAAEADLKRAEAGARMATEAAQAAIEQARAGVAAAEADLARVTAGARPTDIAAAEAQVRQAHIGLTAAQRAVDDLEYLHGQGGVAGSDLAQARTGRDLAQAQLDAAEAQLRGAQAGATAAERAAAEGQLAMAQAGLKQAEAGLGQAALADAGVEAARANVDRARAGAETAAAARDERHRLADAQVAAAQANVTMARGGREAALAGLGQTAAREGEVSAARGNLGQARAGLREAELGRSEAAIRASELLAAQAGLRAAQADRRLAAEQVVKTEIRAPVAGRLTALSLQAGAMAMPGMPAISIETESAAELVCLATAEQRADLRPGQAAQVRLEGSRSSHAGVISEVATSAEGDGRTYRVRLTVAGGGLLPGARATSLVEVAAVEAALAVPRAAVVDLDSDAPYVFVLRDGRAVKRPVTLGLRGTDLLQIVEGLAASDQVVIEGNDTLHDGEPVEVR